MGLTNGHKISSDDNNYIINSYCVMISKGINTLIIRVSNNITSNSNLYMFNIKDTDTTNIRSSCNNILYLEHLGTSMKVDYCTLKIYNNNNNEIIENIRNINGNKLIKIIQDSIKLKNLYNDFKCIF